MAPPTAEIDLVSSLDYGYGSSKTSGTRLSGPLKYSGSLDEHKSFDVTNVIGREFPELQLTEILSDDVKIRDLAILVSQRGVVFFRNQKINIEDQ